jgi:hypothetical protein
LSPLQEAVAKAAEAPRPDIKRDSTREMTRKPEPAKPPEPSVRRSVRPPPIITIDVDEPTGEHRTDELVDRKT